MDLDGSFHDFAYYNNEYKIALLKRKTAIQNVK